MSRKPEDMVWLVNPHIGKWQLWRAPATRWMGYHEPKTFFPEARLGPPSPAVPWLTSDASSQSRSSPTWGSCGDPVLGFQPGPGHCRPPGLWPTYLWISCCRVGNPGRWCLRGSSPRQSLQSCLLMQNSCWQTLSPRPQTAPVGPCLCRRDCWGPGAGLLDKTRQGQVSQHVSTPTCLTHQEAGIQGARNQARPVPTQHSLQKHFNLKGVVGLYVIKSKTFAQKSHYKSDFWVFITYLWATTFKNSDKWHGECSFFQPDPWFHWSCFKSEFLKKKKSFPNINRLRNS